MPRLGRIRLHGLADLGDARPVPIRPDVAAGVDLGIKTLAVVATSTGETFEVPNPRHPCGALRMVRRLSRAVSLRRGPDRRIRTEPSNRWRWADAARNRGSGRSPTSAGTAIQKLTATLAGTSTQRCLQRISSRARMDPYAIAG